jgi:NAD(P)-dependent dehydrogenase (short-subunit alcohol dehydrogenase family)
MNTQKVWFITGASKGMGLETAKLVLANGDKLVATSRNINELISNLGEASENFLPLELDITKDAEVSDAIFKSVVHFGRLDVVLNNAGYYLVGSLEEISEEEFRKTQEVNVFGTVNIIRHVLPYLRKQKSGHIINIASNMGYMGYANTGSYNAAKFAVIGLSEALAQEVKPFGIKVTVVAPGMFRTNFMSETTLVVAEKEIEGYGKRAHAAMLASFNGHQPGDPKKLAQALNLIVRVEEPPVHLILGPDSYNSILEQRKNEQAEMEQWKHLSLSTDLD